MNRVYLSIDPRLLKDIAIGGAARETAIEQLFTAYRRPLLRYFMRRGIDADQAEDLLQDVFVLLVRKASDFRGDTSASAAAWLWAIARNRRTDHLHKTEPDRTLRHHLRHHIDDDEFGDDELSTFPDPGPQVPEMVEAEARDKCVSKAWKAFEHAYPDRAEALRLAEMECLSTSAMAEYLGRTKGATREFLSQCREKFRAFLEPCREFLEP